MFKVGDVYGYIGKDGWIILKVIDRNGSEITVSDNKGRQRVLPVTFYRTEERAEIWQYEKARGYIYADRDAAHPYTCGPNTGLGLVGHWYAVRKDMFDTYENGNYYYAKAFEMLRAQGYGFISVIDDEGHCIWEFAYNDIFLTGGKHE